MTTRDCPICRQPLQNRQSQGVEVDLCEKCGGLWLDKGEFDALIAERFAGGALEDDLVVRSHPPTYCRVCDREERDDTHCSSCLSPLARSCPVDHALMDVLDVVGLELDRCRQCAGFWIDRAARKQLVRSKEKLHDFARELHAAHSDEPFEDFIVDCANCGTRVEVEKCVVRRGHHFCEACVIKGEFVGSDGRKTAVQHAVATREARQRRDERGESNDAVLGVIGGRGGYHVSYSLSLAVGRTMSWLSGLFESREEDSALDEGEEHRAFLERKRKWEK